MLAVALEKIKDFAPLKRTAYGNARSPTLPSVGRG